MAYFYGNLFLRNPELRTMFPLAMDGQRRRLFEALARCVWSSDQQELADYLRDLARDHRKFGVTDKHYRPFCDTLLASLQSSAADWSPQTTAAWRALLDRVATVMTEAARTAAAEPAWWLAEITRHERRRPDLAVLTIRPEAAETLRYRAGQYLSIQLPRWPRTWRRYSIANAPRPDGTLDLHVRAIRGGRVSTALVEQAQPGDSLVLGPPRGSMTLAAAARTGSILCVAGGTGLAPVKAIAEELASQAAGEPVPPVRLVIAARHKSDLYDLPDLQRLAGLCPALTVVPVVSPPGAAARGGLADAAAGQLTPGTSDIFISGPDAMVRAVQRRLARLAPAARIHADTAPPPRPDRRHPPRHSEDVPALDVPALAKAPGMPHRAAPAPAAAARLPGLRSPPRCGRGRARPPFPPELTGLLLPGSVCARAARP